MAHDSELRSQGATCAQRPVYLVGIGKASGPTNIGIPIFSGDVSKPQTDALGVVMEVGALARAVLPSQNKSLFDPFGKP